MISSVCDFVPFFVCARVGLVYLQSVTAAAPANSLTFLDPSTNEVIDRIEFDRPVNLGSVFTSWKTSHIIDDIAKKVGLDADEQGVPEHRKHLDHAGRLLVGHGVAYSGEGNGTTQVSEDVFETRATLSLIAGKRTGPNACTYVNTDTRTLTIVKVSNYA
jgi:hypothetical protein